MSFFFFFENREYTRVVVLCVAFETSVNHGVTSRDAAFAFLGVGCTIFR